MRFFWQKKEPVPQAPEPTKGGTGKRLGPVYEALAQAMRGPKADKQVTVFQSRPPNGFHPPKVGRGEATMAMDSAFAETDAWANSGLGIYGSEGLTFLGYAFLSELAQRPEYRVIVETIAAEMTRKWIKFTSKNADEDKADRINELTEAFQRLNVQEIFEKALEQDGYFGRGHIYIDTDDTDDPKELLKSIGDGWDDISKNKISKKHPVVALRTVEAVWCYPTSYNSNNPLKDDWYRPNQWYAQQTQLHSSRLITLIGHPVPDLLKPTYSFGGLSTSQMVKPYVDYWLQTRDSVGKITSAFSVFVLSTNLSETLQADGDELFRRVDLFNLMRDNRGLMVLDKDSETFQNVSVSLAGLDGLQAQSQEHMASISRIPLVKLLGTQPAGLNSTSEGELRAFYDYIASEQKRRIADDLHRLMGLVMLSLWDEVDEGIDFEFVPLYALTEKEMAELNKTKADTDQILIDTGMISPEEGRISLAADPERGYSNINPEDVPDLGGEEEEGLEPPGGRPQPAAQELEEEKAGLPMKKAAGDSIIAFPRKLAQDEEKWDESKHPRAANGQFGHGGGGASGGGTKAVIEKATQALSKISGWKSPVKFKNGAIVFNSDDGEYVSAIQTNGNWTINLPDGGYAQGKIGDLEKLEKLMKGEQEEASEKSDDLTKKSQETLNFAVDLGYSFKNAPSTNVWMFDKDDSNLLLDTETGKWTLVSPGHLDKTGEGAKALEALLHGPKETWGKAGVKNWHNETEGPNPSLAEPESNKNSTPQQYEKPEHLQTLHTIAAVRPKPTSEQKSAISSYKGSGYEYINSELRKKGQYTERAAHLWSWLDKAELPIDTTVYRGVKGDYAAVLRSIAENGMTFRDRGFISTTTDSKFAKNWQSGYGDGLIMSISVKKGQKGAAIAPANESDGEYEVVLQADSRLKIVSFDFEKKTMHCELVQEEAIMEAPPNLPTSKETQPTQPTPKASPAAQAKPKAKSTSGTFSTEYKSNPSDYSIELSVKDNPHKKEGEASDFFKAIQPGMTVQELYNKVGKGTANAYLQWYLDKGIAKLNKK